ncbi:MAG: Holliday junction branch migration protein RuvA [Ruminococcaceae bacterium]|nr:Holliday junction branch migration protein RuvA [Oscillospiraceae bacterium]
MFSYIKGELTELSTASATIEAHGVGYAITISQTTHGKLCRLQNGETAKLYTYLSVKEDGVDLYGFYDTEELNFFKLLITVSGVGPKAAVSILSAFTVSELASAIIADKPKVISAAQGIGPKTASRIILELKDKISGISYQNGDTELAPVQRPIAPSAGSKLLDAESALEVLGYSRSEIQNVIRDIDAANLSVEDIIRECLARLL